MKVPIDSRHSLPFLSDELLVVPCKVLFGPLSTSPVFLLSSPQAYLRPLRTLVHSRAFVNATATSYPADSYQLYRLRLRHSFFGRPLLTEPGGGIPLGVPTATGTCCKDTLPLNLITCLRAFLHLLLPLLASFSSSLHPHPGHLFLLLFLHLNSFSLCRIKASQIQNRALSNHVSDLFYLFL